MSNGGKEVQRVSSALDEVDRIADPEERVRARNRVLALQATRVKSWHKERRDLVLAMRAEDPPVPVRKIAERLEMSAGVVQDIIRGHSGSWKDRPKTTTAEESNAADDQGSTGEPGDQ